MGRRPVSGIIERRKKDEQRDKRNVVFFYRKDKMEQIKYLESESESGLKSESGLESGLAMTQHSQRVKSLAQGPNGGSWVVLTS